MENFISHFYIENFKSINICAFNNCSRINLLIGKPNVGKSNIIEALSMFSIPFLQENKINNLNQIARVENEVEFFHNGNYSKPANIYLYSTDSNSTYIHYDPKQGMNIEIDIHGEHYSYDIDSKFGIKLILPVVNKSFIKRYSFDLRAIYERGHAKYLIPPRGSNLFNIIESYDNLKQDVIALFKEYNLDIVFDIGSQTIKILQEKNESGIFLIPYSSIADTLQRLIFFKAAIASNDNSVLLFEEPEAHSFPPYMSKFTQDIINKKDNQFFIATHSPYIVNDLLENAREELSIYMVDYADRQTVAKQLTESQLHDIYQYGVDLFTNSESFI